MPRPKKENKLVNKSIKVDLEQWELAKVKFGKKIHEKIRLFIKKL